MKIKSGINLFDGDFTDGGIESGKVWGFYGEPEMGKTLFCLQLSASLLSEGYGVLYIDTENTFGTVDSEDLKYYQEFLGKRFNTDWKKFYFKAYNSLSGLLLDLFSAQIKVIQHESKTTAQMFFPKREKDKTEKMLKQSTKDFRYPQTTPLKKWIDKFNIKMLIIDSFTAPVASEFSPDMQNLGSRAYVVQFVLQMLNYYCKEEDLVGIVTAHSSMSPSARDTFWGYNIWGGSKMMYYVKRWFLLHRGFNYIKKTKLNNGRTIEDLLSGREDVYFRTFWRRRFPKGFGHPYIPIIIKKDYGFADIDILR